MTDPANLETAYQATILHHARHPVGFGGTFGLTSYQEQPLVNPLCGDEVTVILAWDDVSRAEVRFHCRACLLCKASASIMAATLSGAVLSDVERLLALVRKTYPLPGQDLPTGLTGDLPALYDLRRYPSRQRCVLLPWDALAELLYH